MAEPALKVRKPANSSKRDDCMIVVSDFADFLNGLQSGSVDLILTDPPYAISRATGFKKLGSNSVKRLAVSMDFGTWDQEQIDLDRLAACMLRALRTGGTAIVWYDLWKVSFLAQALAQAGFKMLRLVTWEKTNPVPLNTRSTYLSNGREVAVCAVKGGKPTFHGHYDKGIYEAPIPRHQGRRLHPTQKPLGVFQELVAKHSNPGDLIVDPFLGSGTTAVAAMSAKRRFAGCDISPAYVKTARKRALKPL